MKGTILQKLLCTLLYFLKITSYKFIDILLFFSLFYNCIIFHCVGIPEFFSTIFLFLIHENIVCFQYFSVINGAAVRNLVYMYFHAVGVYLQGRFLEVRIPGSKVSAYVVFIMYWQIPLQKEEFFSCNLFWKRQAICSVDSEFCWYISVYHLTSFFSPPLHLM